MPTTPMMHLAAVCALMPVGLAQQFQWAMGAGGPSFDQGTSIAVDASGYAFVTGSMTGSGTFGSMSFQQANPWANTVVIAKMSVSTGAILWAIAPTHGGPTTSSGAGIAVDTSGNAFVTGFVSGTGTVSFGNVSLSCSGTFDAFVAKFDGSTGTMLWVLQMSSSGTNSHLRGIAIALDSLGNALVPAARLKLRPSSILCILLERRPTVHSRLEW
jgi:hypothetical protein